MDGAAPMSNRIAAGRTATEAPAAYSQRRTSANRSASGCGDAGDAALSGLADSGGAEVDFVVYGNSGLQAFEIKKVCNVHPAGLPSLRTFREDNPQSEAATLNRGSERVRIDDVWCLPVTDFLRRTPPAGVTVQGRRCQVITLSVQAAYT